MAILLKPVADSPGAGQAVGTHMEELGVGEIIFAGTCIVALTGLVIGLCWEIERGVGWKQFSDIS